MSYQEKNTLVTLGSFVLILGYYVSNLFQMVQTDSFTSENVFRLWIIVIVLSIVVMIVALILAHAVPAIVQAIKTQQEPDIEDIQDERDRLIDLRGTKVTYYITSAGVFLSMLTFALGQSPLVMFASLIFFTFLAQIVGDIFRLYLSRSGF